MDGKKIMILLNAIQEVNPIIKFSNDMFAGPIILLALFAIPFIFTSFASSLGKVKDEHNEKYKDHPKFVPATDEDTRNGAGCWTIIVGGLLLALAIFMVATQGNIK